MRLLSHFTLKRKIGLLGTRSDNEVDKIQQEVLDCYHMRALTNLTVLYRYGHVTFKTF